MEATMGPPANLIACTPKLNGEQAGARQLDERIWSLPPHTAISYGYTIYRAYTRKKGSCGRRQAKQVVRDMETLMGSFPLDSPEGRYLLTVRQAAISFANGIRRSKQQQCAKLRAAKAYSQQFRDKNKRENWLGSALSTGGKLLLAAGFTMAIVKALLLTPLLGAPDPSVRHLDPQYVSLSLALGTALVCTYVRGWMQDRKIGRVLENYEKKTAAAYKEYVKDVIAEYRFSAHEAQTAWTTMTQRPAPTTPAFDDLLIDLFCGHREGIRKDEVSKCDTAAPATAAAPIKLSWKQRFNALIRGHA